RLAPRESSVGITVQVDDISAEMGIEFEKPPAASIDIGPGVRFPLKSEVALCQGDPGQMPQIIPLLFGGRWPKNGNQHFVSLFSQEPDEFGCVLPDSAD